jgi:hypothetical protein
LRGKNSSGESKKKESQGYFAILSVSHFSLKNCVGQSKYIDGLLGSKRRGFYVEAGGFDGELFSNSLFFELERDWHGILIEANKQMFEAIVARKRRTYALNACLADKVRNVENTFIIIKWLCLFYCVFHF